MTKVELPGKGTDYVGVTTCFICHDGAGRIYMAQRSQNARDEKGTWEIGGGGLDFGVKALDNAIREIEEEYSSKPEEIKFLGYRDVFRNLSDGTPTHWLAIDFLARLEPTKTKINEPHKVDDAGWFKPTELPNPLHSQIETILSKYARELAAYNIIVPTEFAS